MVMKIKAIIGIILVVASVLKLTTMWGIIHISWLERVSDNPWAAYLAPVVLIIVGSDLICQYIRSKKQ